METVDQHESDEQLPITSSTLPSEGSLDHYQYIITEPSEESRNQSVEQSNNSIVADISEENFTLLLPHNPTFDLSELTKPINTHNELADNTHRCYDHHRDPPRCDRYRESSRERPDTPYRDQSRERLSYLDSSRGPEPSPHYSSRDRSRKHRHQDFAGSRH